MKFIYILKLKHFDASVQIFFSHKLKLEMLSVHLYLNSWALWKLLSFEKGSQ